MFNGQCWKHEDDGCRGCQVARLSSCGHDYPCGDQRHVCRPYRHQRQGEGRQRRGNRQSPATRCRQDRDAKVTHVERLLQEKPADGYLAFVGDGINDAPVLARADVGIAMGGLGSDAAIEAADVVLMDDQPSKIALAVSIARRTLAIARQNVWFAIGVKVAVLILAALGIATMWLAVFADVGVTVLAVLNAMRTLRV